MSSRKRRDKDAPDIFGNVDDTPMPDPMEDDSLTNLTNRAYGGPDLVFQADKKRVSVKQIDIDNIQPDPLQPRRAIPSELQAAWDADNVMVFFETWADEANIDLNAFFFGDGDYERPEELTHLQASLFSLLDTTLSIQRDGLINPITVVRFGGGYKVETGERRWIAHHLLREIDPDNDWETIPARIDNESDVWRQASENNAREDLNAIAKARQLALLLMDLYGWENFKPFEQFIHEKNFYAQVSDGNEFRVPRGMGDRIVNAMGLANTSQIRYHRSLLRLPSNVWTIADDYSVSMKSLRTIASKAKSEQHMEQLLYQVLAEMGYSVSQHTVSKETTDPMPKPKLPLDREFAEKVMPKLERKFILSASDDELRNIEKSTEAFLLMIRSRLNK